MRKTIIKHIGPYEDLLATVKRRKQKWYGHVTRPDGLTKVILQGTVEGSRRRSRPRKSWIENIVEWTGKSFAKTQVIALNRQAWKELTRKSIMTCPYGSSRSQETKARQCKVYTPDIMDRQLLGSPPKTLVKRRTWSCQIFKEKCRHQYLNPRPPGRLPAIYHGATVPLDRFDGISLNLPVEPPKF